MKIKHIHGDVTLSRFRYFQAKNDPLCGVKPKLVWLYEDFCNYFWMWVYGEYPRIWSMRIKTKRFFYNFIFK